MRTSICIGQKTKLKHTKNSTIRLTKPQPILNRHKHLRLSLSQGFLFKLELPPPCDMVFWFFLFTINKLVVCTQGRWSLGARISILLIFPLANDTIRLNYKWLERAQLGEKKNIQNPKRRKWSQPCNIYGKVFLY